MNALETQAACRQKCMRHRPWIPGVNDRKNNLEAVAWRVLKTEIG